MSDNVYASPSADVTLSNLKVRKGATTAWGIVLLILGILGFLFALLGAIAVFTTPSPYDEQVISLTEFTVDACLSVAGKVLLLMVAVGLLRRARLTLTLAVITFVFSTIDSIFKAIVIIPPQAMASGQVTATNVGFYTIAAMAALVYLALIAYLRADSTRAEFAHAVGREG